MLCHKGYIPLQFFLNWRADGRCKHDAGKTRQPLDRDRAANIPESPKEFRSYRSLAVGTNRGCISASMTLDTEKWSYSAINRRSC
jgi:hypothetical protein